MFGTILGTPEQKILWPANC